MVRRIDAFSPHISVAKTYQFVIPQLTITDRLRQQVTLHNAKVKEQTNTYEGERISFTFRSIDITGSSNKAGADDWSIGTGGGGHKHKK